MTQWGGGEPKKHLLEKFEGGSSVWTKQALEPDCWGQLAPGKTLTSKKERKKSKNPKISTAQTVFLLQFLNIGKLYVFKKKRNCKGSISPIIKLIEWTLLHTSVLQLRHFYSSKRKRRRKKGERRKRTVERYFCLMFSCWFNIAGILKREKKKELFLKSHHYFFNHCILKFIIF